MDEKKLPHDHGQSMERELDHMPSAEDFQTAADIFKQLGDGSRIRIFWLLCHCEECVINLSSMVDMSSPAVSHHLKQLKAARLIVSRREGKEVYYKAAETEQAQLLHHMIEAMVEIACPSSAGGQVPAR
ncbi:ArsR/SmtB family transcription factor [Oscillibacter valericigenes]|uniref:ArsR/SmtB family transcription factor n=1 Tax=Oscillibacter valericigenes TaxID=351091 RepID=UPI001958BFCB|nr:metalloregulator ArsR/SmtB family transcription factor [Oscillibacter valericigenes]MBM6909059.1 winged helix-turn-helix transcriptional regulator [Oscillibacter valericigenes]